MITEDYVNFETAKLLKEKGFDEKGVKVWYDESGEMYYDCREIKYQIKIENHEKFFQCPTLQMAMKWLREVYNIAVSVYVFNRDLPIKENGIRYTCDIATTKMSSKEGHLRLTGTYEEACETAIRYCLENLI